MNAAEQKGGKEYCKDYQYHIKQCKHIKLANFMPRYQYSNPPPWKWFCKAIEAERTLDSTQTLFQLHVDNKQSIKY